MNNFVMYDKLSKKEKKKLDSAKRTMWSDYGCQSPMTKIVKDKKKQADKYMCRGKIKEL